MLLIFNIIETPSSEIGFIEAASVINSLLPPSSFDQSSNLKFPELLLFSVFAPDVNLKI